MPERPDLPELVDSSHPHLAFIATPGFLLRDEEGRVPLTKTFLYSLEAMLRAHLGMIRAQQGIETAEDDRLTWAECRIGNLGYEDHLRVSVGTEEERPSSMKQGTYREPTVRVVVERFCRVCGCTDVSIMTGPKGCFWVEADLCSECENAAQGGKEN